ncbi:hypothetical protein CL659_01875 [bacterium]|nr:hypothetical protein [bacterium]|tara:strand:- start:6271 stop:7233 length:963 start_codon:yes stop_codon:yes gene_type:complete
MSVTLATFFIVYLVSSFCFNASVMKKHGGTLLKCESGILRTNLRIILYLIGLIFGSFVVVSSLDIVQQSIPEFPSVGPILAMLVLIFISEFFFNFFDKKGTLGLSISKKRLLEGVEGLNYGAVIFIACLLPSLLTGSIDPFTNMPGRLNPSLLGEMFGILIIAALFEEVLFRGYIFRTLTYTCPAWIPLTLSSFIFSYVHWNQAVLTGEGDTLQWLFRINVFLAGWIMAKLIIRTGNLWYAWWWHFSWNFIQGPILGISVSGTDIGKEFGAIYKEGNDLITGGSIGIEASLPATIILYLAIIKEKEITQFFKIKKIQAKK